MKKSFTLTLVAILLCALSTTEIEAQIVEIESTTDGFLPPRMNDDQRDAIPVTEASDGMIIFNIETGLFNYYDGINEMWLELYSGPHTTPTISPIDYFRSLPNGIQVLLDAGESPINIINAGAPTTDFIGLNYAGGIIFYIESNGTGLVATDTDQSTGAEWGCSGTPITGADGTAIGTGNQNTIDIEAGCADEDIAADICAKLDLNGFDDWFLPSIDELNEIYTKIGQGETGPNENIGGFAADFYWSSSEIDDDKAWGLFFTNGDHFDLTKFVNYRVRAIRAF